MNHHTQFFLQTWASKKRNRTFNSEWCLSQQPCVLLQFLHSVPNALSFQRNSIFFREFLDVSIELSSLCFLISSSLTRVALVNFWWGQACWLFHLVLVLKPGCWQHLSRTPVHSQSEAVHICFSQIGSKRCLFGEWKLMVFYTNLSKFWFKIF